MYFADGLAVDIRWVRKTVGLVSAVVLAATVLVAANAQEATAQSVSYNQSAAERCSAHHLFGAEPVDVAKTADGETVLAQVSWGYDASIGCYLALDRDAVAALRAAGPPQSLPRGQTDTSRRCSAFHLFGAEPVDAAKTADGQTVLARVSWGWNGSICYLVLDPAAVNTLRVAAIPPATAPGVPTNVTATAGNRQITVEWTAPADDGGAAITSYTVAYKATRSACPATIDRTWTRRTTTRTTTTLASLANGTDYRLCVRATNSAGSSGWADVSATPASVPGTPTNVTATTGTRQLTVEWTAPADNGDAITSYTVQRCAAANRACTSTWADAGTATTNRHTITGLDNGTAYGIRIRATNANGAGSWSSTAFGSTVVIAPGTPSDLSTTIGSRYITLSWTAPSTGGSPITRYTVECRLADDTVTSGNCDSSSWIVYRTSSNTSITISSLTNGVTYDLRVKATNKVGDSAWSEVATATPSATPGTPSNVQALPSGRNMTVTWRAPSSGGAAITGYTVEYCSGTCRSTTVSGDPLPTTATLTGLSEGTTYTVRVRAVNVAGDSSWSSSATARIPSKPGSPKLTGFSISNYTGTVSWDAPDSDGGSTITNYEVELCVGSSTTCTDTGGPWRTQTKVVATPAKLENLSGAKTHNVRVRALNAAGSGGWSDILRRTTTAATVPDAPTGVTATPGSRRITVQWTAPDAKGARITGYTVARKAGATACLDIDSTWTTTTTTTTSETISGLINDKTYAICVRATNSKGNSPWNTDSASTAVQATPATTPSAPANLTASPGDKWIVLNWVKPTSGGSTISGYIVEYKASGSNWSFATVTSSTTYTITGLTNGTTYSVRVQTVSDTGNSRWSTKTVSLPKTPTGSLSAAQNREAGQLKLTWIVYDNNDATPEVAQIAANSGNCPTGSSTLPSEWTTATTNNITGSTSGELTTYPITVTGLSHGTTYRLCVRDEYPDISDSSFWSITVSATTPTTPNAPSGLTAKAGKAQISLSWNPYTYSTDGGTAITSYTVQCRLVEGTAAGSHPCHNVNWANSGLAVGSGDTTATISNLSNNATYRVQVKATNGAGDSDWSTITSDIKPSTVPGAPTDVTATHSNTSVTLAWTAPAANNKNITSYTVAYKAPAAACSSINSTWTTTTTATTSKTISGLTNGTEYGFCVRATNSNGSGNWTSSATQNTPSTVPGAPTNVTATPGDDQITVTWPKPATGGSPITSYKVAYRASYSSCPGSTPDSDWTIATSTSSADPITVTISTGIFNGTSYRVCVRATNLNGNGNWSNAGSITPSVKPDPPADLAATAGKNQIKLTWTAYTTTGNSRTDGGSSITGYNVVYRTGTHTNCPNVTDLSDWTLKPNLSSSYTEYTVSGLTASTTYTLCIWATNAKGPSSLSRDVETTTAS